ATALSKEPKYVNQTCYGIDLRYSNYANYREKHPKQVNLRWLIQSYIRLNHSTDFFDRNFNYHAGNSELQEQIKNGVSEKEIRQSWQKDIEAFKLVRKKYLLYEDF